MTDGVDSHWIRLDDARQNCRVYYLVCLKYKTHTRLKHDNGAQKQLLMDANIQ